MGESGRWVLLHGAAAPGTPRPAPSTHVVIEGPGVNLPAALVVQRQFTVLNETIMTPKAGRLAISKSVTDLSAACSGTVFTYVFITVDGVPLRSSTVFQSGPLTGTLVGTTSGPVASGSHVLSIGAQCLVGTVTGTGYTNVTASSTTVLP